MKNNLTSSLKIQLDAVEKQAVGLSESLLLLEKEIRFIFDEIKKCSDSESASYFFQELEAIHTSLSLVMYRAGISLSENLKKFLKDFDRVDDLATRNLLYKKIIDG